MTTRKRTNGTAAELRPAPGKALLAFLSGWQQLQDGALTAGRSVVLHYEPARLAEARAELTAPLRDVVSFARFLPSGVVRHTVLRQPAGRRTTTALPRMGAEIAIPHETQHVELWFQGVDADGTTTWDSRFGHNYRFDVVRPQPSSSDTLAPLASAVVDPEKIHVADDAAVKENGFPSRSGYPSGMSSQETTLRVGARVRGTAVPRRVWVEVRTFDGDALPVSSETRALELSEPRDGDGATYTLDDLLYQGAQASPGSVTPRPDVRMMQYRLYCTIGRKTYTDGVLHRCELATDAVTS